MKSNCSELAVTPKQTVTEAPECQCLSRNQQDFLATFIFVDQTSLSACCKVVVKQEMTPYLLAGFPCYPNSSSFHLPSCPVAAISPCKLLLQSTPISKSCAAVAEIPLLFHFTQRGLCMGFLQALIACLNESISLPIPSCSSQISLVPCTGLSVRPAEVWNAGVPECGGFRNRPPKESLWSNPASLFQTVHDHCGLVPTLPGTMQQISC